MDTVKIRHKDNSGVGEVPRRHLAFWQKRGYEAVEDEQTETPVPALPEGDGTPVDPAGAPVAVEGAPEAVVVVDPPVDDKATNGTAAGSADSGKQQGSAPRGSRHTL
jgi:hypothetical protein